MKVSIIVPCYNHAKYLPNAVEAAINQTYTNLEVVVINDGSTDNTDEIMQQYLSNPKIKYVSQHNVGLAISRNNAITICSGAWILPLDADDKIPEDFIEQVVGKVYDKYSLVTTRTVETDANLNVIADREFNPDCLPHTTVDQIWVENRMTCTTLFSKTMWEEVGGFDPVLSKVGYEDWDFWIRMITAGCKTVYQPATYMLYRKHANSMVSNSVGKHTQIVDYMRSKSQQLTPAEYSKILRAILK